MPAIPHSAYTSYPSLSSGQSQLSRRGIQSESCASTCMTNTAGETCETLDSNCLCLSSTWQDSILVCFQHQCEAQENLDTAYDEFVTFCNQSSKPFTSVKPIFSRTIITPSATSTASLALSQLGVVNVSAVMAGVCTLFLVAGVIFGVIGVRDKLKHQKQMLEHDSLRSKENNRKTELEDNAKPDIQMAQMLSGVGSRNDMVTVQLDEHLEERLERLRKARKERAENALAVRVEPMDRRASVSSCAESTMTSSDRSPTSSVSSYHPDHWKSRSSVSLKLSSGYMEYSDRTRDLYPGNEHDNQSCDREEEEDERLNRHVSLPSTGPLSNPQPFLSSGEATPTHDAFFPGHRGAEPREEIEEDLPEFLYDEDDDDERLTWGAHLPVGRRVDSHW